MEKNGLLHGDFTLPCDKDRARVKTREYCADVPRDNADLDPVDDVSVRVSGEGSAVEQRLLGFSRLVGRPGR